MTLDEDGLDFLVAELTIAELPVVLDVLPRYDSERSATEAIERGRVHLHAEGLLPENRVHPDLEYWLRILEQPQWYVELRRYPAPGGVDRDDSDDRSRTCFASDGRSGVLAHRGGNSVTVQAAPGHPVDHLLAAVRKSKQTPGLQGLQGLNAPTDLLSEVLDKATSDAAATSSRLVHLGVGVEAANIVAAAMSTCRSITEIGAITRRHGQRIVAQHPVAVFETDRGAIVATSSTAQDGRAWTTLTEATPASLRRAVASLAEEAQDAV